MNAAFPVEGLRFLKSLKRNNNRDWFLEHRPVYEKSVRAPMLRIVEALAVEFARFAPDIVTSKSSIFRIHRDTRFSKDKSPYKTQVAAMFTARGLDRHEGAGFYFHIAPTQLWIGGGLYRPQPDVLRLVREHIAEHYKPLMKILAAASFRKIFGELSGEQSTRMPRGFSPDHPAERLLRHKDLIALRELQPEEASHENFAARLVESFKALHPLIHFLNDPILRRRRLQDRRDQVLSERST